MTKFKKVGGGSYEVYRPEPKKPFDWGALFGGMILIFIVLAALGSCTT